MIKPEVRRGGDRTGGTIVYGKVCRTTGCLFSHSSSPVYPIVSDAIAATTRAAEDTVFYAARSAEVATRATAPRDDGQQHPERGRASDTRATSRGDGSGRAGGGWFSSMGNVRNGSLPRQEDRCAFSNRGRGSFRCGGRQHDQRQAASTSGDILDQAAIVEDEDF